MEKRIVAKGQTAKSERRTRIVDNTSDRVSGRTALTGAKSDSSLGILNGASTPYTKSAASTRVSVLPPPLATDAGDAIPAGGARILRVDSGEGWLREGTEPRGGNGVACVQITAG